MNNKTILLVEDNPDDEALALRALQKNNITTEVVVAHDGADALEYLFSEGSYSGRDTRIMPDLILLDLKLPKINGLEVLRRIRDDKRTQCIPVVILTTSNEERDLNDSYVLGANSYICKPVGFAQFNQTVEQLGFYWLVLNVPPPMGRTV
jgi:CheY-like chemotaxis protein